MKIIVVYHCPCLDGAFSLMTFVLFAKFALLNEYKGDFSLFFSKLLAFSPQNHEISSEQISQKIDEEIKEEKEDKIEKEDKFEKDIKIEKGVKIDEKIDNKTEKEDNFTDFLTNQDLHPDFQYYAIKPSINQESIKNLIKTLRTYTIPQEIIIILLDYYGETLETLAILSQISAKLIIIDHHESFLSLFPSENPLANLLIKFEINHCAASLTYDFSNGFFGDLLPKNLKNRLISLQKYIEDHDIRTKKYPETDAIISALYILIRDLSAKTNPLLFFSLLKHDTEILKELGHSSVQKRRKDVEKAKLTKKMIKIPLKEKIVKGFCCIIQDSGLINDLGETLAKESLEEGMDNIGVVLKKNCEGYRVSIRGDNACGESPCLELAKLWGGGGHKYSAGAWISKKKLKKFMN